MARIYLTGRVTIETPSDSVEAAAFPGRQGRLAFVRLAAEPRRVEREELAHDLWDDGLPDAWESALSALVSKLRKLFAEVGFDGTIDAVDGTYELRVPADTWIDLRVGINSLDRAEGALRRGDPEAAWGDATVASTVFRRRFLPGEYGAWVVGMRSRLADLEIRTHDVLARVWLLRDDPVQALASARHLVDLAPFSERCRARLMEAHLAAGNRAEAIRSYEQVRRLLADELGIEPGPRIQALYEEALR